MTLGWADGVPLGDNAAIDAAGHDRRALGERVLGLFLNHALRDGYFHADMHQGNLKVAPNGDIIAYDFGIMGHIDAYTRRVYAEILFGFIKRDYKRVAEVHFEAGYVPADRDVDEFARALRAVGEPIFGMDAAHISMGRLLNYLFEVTERFGMETRTELILLQRTMVVVEGVARSLDPHINIWEGRPPGGRRLHQGLHWPPCHCLGPSGDRARDGPVRPPPARAGGTGVDRPVQPAGPWRQQCPHLVAARTGRSGGGRCCGRNADAGFLRKGHNARFAPALGAGPPLGRLPKAIACRVHAVANRIAGDPA